ncbi:oxygenase MpaB family protein [Mycobacterium sp. PSTR-4-N]|uniref:oxygenase MpaB family protein n=1 Tax=Mycobacterium sp. PSTR-4-N TaxID=2917745 RepID=UPI001F14AB04|nr:oxygenase MpaB family protein [Mycobacterium sp. PSTR-4-N]MCG7593261.1 oxygenase MpaB family protein [Mycobacterium sp. PSTR-4-N]
MTQDTSATCPVTSASDDVPVTAGCPVTGGYDDVPAALGPDSLTWKYFGQWTGMLQGPWAGSMQNMHPQLGAAVAQHSIFFLERMPRLFRSVYPIGGVVFDGDRAPRTGAEVRDYHIGIKGVDDEGRRYSALNPDVFYWAHATFFKSTLLAAEWVGGGLTDAQKRQLFDEHVTWYRMYGMSMRPVPASWEDFERYWDHMCRNVLENNWAAREVMDLSTMPKHPSLDWLPDWLWRLNIAAMQRFFNFATVGLYDPPVRELMGYSWTPRQARLHALFGRAVYLTTRLLPKRMLMHPRKRSAWDRAHGRLPSDAPLVETPARNLPPVEYRGDPHFYCPTV